MSRTRFGKIFLTFSFILSLSFTNSFAEDSAAAAVAAPAAAAPAASPLVEKGKQLFEDNCKSCHKIHEKSAGPALAGVEARVPGGRKAIFPWVRNSKLVLKSGDPYFTKLFAEYGGSEMTTFPTFTDEDLNALLDYIDAEGKIKPVEKKDEVTKDGKTEEKSGSGAYDTVILVLIIVVLFLVLITLTVFLNVIKKYLTDKEAKLDEEEKELLNQKFDVMGVLKSRVFIGIIIFIFLCMGTVACWKGLISIGVEQNYKPAQPIPYSHKLHAGDLKINCNYCHTGVYKGKQANIPSLNICMNCHNEKGVGSGPKYGTEAIAVLRKAYADGTPIQWIRVHNLPDLAYFNHSQHTNVAGLECEQCHGPIKEMEVVKQYSPLTMGWCINCHRETKVNGKDSKYYDWMLEQHAKQKKGYRPGQKIEAVTEAELGGLECAKCHY